MNPRMIDELASVNLDIELVYEENEIWMNRFSIIFKSTEQPVTAVNMTQRKVLAKWDAFIGEDNEWHIPFSVEAA